MDEKEKAPAEPKKTAKTKEPESVYEAEELARNARVLGASYALVKVALRLAKKDHATLKEAQKIVDEFKNREVK